MPSVTHEMERRLLTAELDLLRRAAGAAAESGVELFLVGGSVRDVLSGRHPADLDVVAVGGGAGFASRLAGQLGGELVAHSRFGTAKLKVDDLGIDLAAARTETYAHPGALPDVSPAATIGEDLARRDFSINAMAVSLGENSWGDLPDPFQGRRDLEASLIRVLQPNSFVDDATRILRAIRYSSRLRFRFEEETERLLRRDLAHLASISGDRIRHELERIFGEPRAASMLQAAQDLGVLRAIHPALHIEPALLERVRELAIEPGRESELRLLGVLVFAVPAAEIPGVISRLNMNGGWAAVVRDVGAARDSLTQLKDDKIRRSRVFGLLRGLSTAAIDACALAADEPLVRERLGLYLSELRHVRPLLDGRDLLAMGMPEGPIVGELIEKLLTARLEGLVSTREDEETMVRRSLNESSGV